MPDRKHAPFSQQRKRKKSFTNNEAYQRYHPLKYIPFEASHTCAHKLLLFPQIYFSFRKKRIGNGIVVKSSTEESPEKSSRLARHR